jgi:hypothetical protein
MPLATPATDHYCFIVHDNVPYCYDINYILAMPSGFRYRNRFRRTWIEGNLHSNIAAMVGSEVLIILRVQAANRLIPVRWGTIREAQQVGDIYYFEYILGDLVSYSAEPAKRDDNIRDATRLFAGMHVWLPGSAGQMLTQPSVFRSTAGISLDRKDADDFDAWGNLVQAVTTAVIYERAEFLKVMGLYNLKGRKCPVDNEQFVIRSNTIYRLRVWQYVPKPGPTATVTPHDIDVATFSDHFVQLRSRQRAVGLYDMLNFWLKSRRLPPKELSAIEIPHNPAPAGTGSYAPGALYLPVITSGRSPVLVVFWLAVLAACLVGMFAPAAYHANATIIRNLATVVFILVISGWRSTLDAVFPSLPWQASK